MAAGSGDLIMPTSVATSIEFSALSDRVKALESTVAGLVASQPPPPLIESPSGTTISGPGRQLVDGAKRVWELNLAKQLVIGGTADVRTSNVVLAGIWNHQCDQQNAAGGWWACTGLDAAGLPIWLAVSDPRTVAPPTTGGGTGPAATGGLASVDFAALTGKTVVRELFGGSCAQMCDNNFASFSDPAIGAAIRKLNLPLLRLNCNSGAASAFKTIFANPGAPNWAPIDGLVQNLHNMVDLTKTKIMMGFGGASDNNTLGWTVPQFAANAKALVIHLRTTPGGDGKPIDPRYWEMMNEPSIPDAAYVSYFNAFADAIHSVDPTYVTSGVPHANVWSQDAFLIAGSNATTLGMLGGHCYLYCPGPDATPGDDDVCAATGPNTPGSFVAGLNGAIVGTYMAGKPWFNGEYNIGCGPNDTQAREGTQIGACFTMSWCLGLAARAGVETWGGWWDYGSVGGWYPSFADSSLRPNPPIVALSRATAVMPGKMVSASPGLSKVFAFATVNGADFAVCLINGSGTTVSGPVGLGHWPLNATGAATITKWDLTSASPLGVLTSLAVSGGVTAPISIPARGIVMLSSKS